MDGIAEPPQAVLITYSGRSLFIICSDCPSKISDLESPAPEIVSSRVVEWKLFLELLQLMSHLTLWSGLSLRKICIG
ncbi:unnamed protein product [Pleuronectes platessa]|uniref:Uncharacterized protein n=1 Tax=Pleuronectes platessa TaxID=8262 RepID=A0A9N7UQU6_PLEPL|nr:unnamed protein product [Pleuronectes platessa]